MSDVTVTLDADALRDVLSAAYAGKPHVYVDQERLTARSDICRRPSTTRRRAMTDDSPRVQHSSTASAHRASSG
jgi:hypothetical protein